MMELKRKIIKMTKKLLKKKKQKEREILLNTYKHVTYNRESHKWNPLFYSVRECSQIHVAIIVDASGKDLLAELSISTDSRAHARLPAC